MMQIGIITAPRPRSTIGASIESMRKAGFKQDVTIFAEPGTDLPVCDGCHIMQNSQVLGNFRNWVACLQWLTAAPSEWYMICEDDIAWASNAAADLDHDLFNWRHPSSAGALSLYCPIRMSKVIERRYGSPLVQGYYGINLGRSTWGAQCLVFHHTWAASLLNSSVLRAYMTDPRWQKNVDALVADALLSKGFEILYRIPCLVNHTYGDANSSLGYKPDRPELLTKYFKDQ